MQIGITDALRPHLELSSFDTWQEYDPAVETDPFFCWDVQKVDTDEFSVILACNTSNRFGFVWTATDDGLDKLKEDFDIFLRRALTEQGFTENATKAYGDMAGKPQIGRTHGKGPLARTRPAVSWVHFYAKSYDASTRYQEELTDAINRYRCCCHSFEDESTPKKFMAHDLIRHDIMSPLVDAGYDIGKAVAKQPRIRPEGTGPHPLTFTTTNAEGKRIRFDVTHIETAYCSEWVAHEVVSSVRARREKNYLGTTVYVTQEHDMSEDEALKKLKAKTRKVLQHRSIDSFGVLDSHDHTGRYYTHHIVTTLKPEGWGTIVAGEDEDDIRIVIDGTSYTGTEFLWLASAYEGDILCWELRSRSEEIPLLTDEPWE